MYIFSITNINIVQYLKKAVPEVDIIAGNVVTQVDFVGSILAQLALLTSNLSRYKLAIC